MQGAPGTDGLALRYALRRAGARQELIAVPPGAVSSVRMQDSGIKARFVASVLDARCGPDEELELLGQSVMQLGAAGRSSVLGRIGVLTPALGLISNLNLWENISLAPAYHGTPPRDRVVETATRALASFDIEPLGFLSRMPDELGTFEKKLVAFVRLLAAEPELAVFDALGEGLTGGERSRAARFEAEYKARQPSGTLLFVDVSEDRA